MHIGTVGPGVVSGFGHTLGECTDTEIDGRHASGARYIPFRRGQGGPWYATKADALLALHWAAATKAAETLRKIELMREAEHG